MTGRGVDSYNRIAPYYDSIAKLVFGNSIIEGQLAFLNEIKSGMRVLIIGGGTGWIAREILSRKSVDICYVDSSLKMLAMARETTSHHPRIEFVHATHNSIPDHADFDVVITNFFLDLFDQEELPEIISRIRSYLKPEALWLVTDFLCTGKFWQAALLRLMYLFFRLTTGLRTTKLPRWKELLQSAGMVQTQRMEFFSGFIGSAVFQLSVQ